MSEVLRQVGRKSYHERGCVFCPLITCLIELHDVPSDQPQYEAVMMTFAERSADCLVASIILAMPSKLAWCRASSTLALTILFFITRFFRRHNALRLPEFPSAASGYQRSGSSGRPW